MSAARHEIRFAQFGGVNYSDQPPTILDRAFGFDGRSFSQRAPIEFIQATNIDFVDRAIGKRNGSTALESLATVMATVNASEALVDEFEWVTPGTTTRVRIAVGIKSIYTDQSGSWAQINDSASAAYTHDSDVAKCSFVVADGHLFICLDGANNEIQVYRTGANLDPQLANGNLYTEAKGGGTQTITGTWGKGYYIGFYLHARLCFGNGDSIIEYTDVGQPWDLAGGGYYQASSNVVGAIPFVPKGANELNAIAFISTVNGPEFVSGFDLSDTIKPMQGGSVALNHRVLTALDNWVVYLTRSGSIEGVNFNQTIDLGRRLKALDGVSGPMDTFDVSNAAHVNLPFVFNDKEKKQVQWYYPDASQTTNSHAIIMDYYLGEPFPNERIEGYEPRIRLIPWSIEAPATNPWFIAIYDRNGSPTGVLADGRTFTLESGTNDLDTLPILDTLQIPHFNAGNSSQGKNIRRCSFAFKPKGLWSVDVRKFLDRDTNPVGQTYALQQAPNGASVYDTATYDVSEYASAGIFVRDFWAEEYAFEYSMDLRNQNVGENWILAYFDIEYSYAAR